MSENFGWLGPDEEQRAIDATMERDAKILEQQPDYIPQYVAFDGFSSAGPRQMPGDSPEAQRFNDPDEFFCFEWVRKHFGEDTPPGPQDLGDCVGYSASIASCDLATVEVQVGGELEVPKRFFVPWTYGIGRVYIGGNRIRGDGSLGDWQIAACRKYGLLSADTPGLPQYSSAVGREWGSSRSVLDKWADKAAPYTIGNGVQIKSVDELLKRLIDDKKPCTIASNQGFERNKMDEETGCLMGIPSGSWGHQMSIRGGSRSKRMVFIGNQWGNRYKHKNAFWPAGGFGVSLDVMDDWLNKGGVFCTSYEMFNGFRQGNPLLNGGLF